MKKFLVLCSALFVLCTSVAAQADEWMEYLKFSCIPEIGYMELTTTSSYEILSREDAEKAGLYVIKAERFCIRKNGSSSVYEAGDECEKIERRIVNSPSCSFPKYDKEVVFKLKYHSSQFNRWFTLTVNVNDDDKKSFEYFGFQIPYLRVPKGRIKAYAPHVLSYQIFGGEYIHACTGKGMRECDSFNVTMIDREKEGKE